METLIITHLLHDEKYMRKVLPFMNLEYFASSGDKKIIEHIINFENQYHVPPTVEALTVLVQKETNLKEGEYNEIIATLEECKTKTETPLDFLVDETEKFCKEKAVYNAVKRSIKIIDGLDPKMKKDALPSLLQDALAVGFDNSVGHDYINDAEARYEYYTNSETRIQSDLAMLNLITRGGVKRKTLNLIIAGIHVGKTMVMCHLAAAYKSQGYNVLYITLEMGEEEICERIDANLMNVAVDDLPTLPKSMFMSRIEKIKSKSEGRLIIKEFPTGGAHAGHFRALMSELKTKQNFTADVVFVDYIGIVASQNLKSSENTNSYMKEVSKELRGLAKEQKVAMWSGAQLTRSGIDSSDPTMTDTAEAISLPAIADLQLALIRTDELDRLGQILLKQLKNRYRRMTKNKRFVIGLDEDKQRLYDVEQDAQRDIMADPHANDAKKIVLSDGTSKYGDKDFSGIKVS
jgi:replicative DNA helicase